MELRLSIFLFFIMVVTFGYTAMSLVLFKMFAHVSNHLEKGVMKFEQHGPKRLELLSAFLQSTERAVQLTESIKVQITNLSPKVETLQVKYEFALAKVDANFERFADGISHSAECVRDAVAAPAEKVEALSAGIQSVAAFIQNREDD